MSGVWYNASGSSNILKNSYINGFLDVSSMFLTRSDASMAGNVYIGGTAGLNVNNSMSMNGVINQLVSTPMIGNTVFAGGSTMNDSFIGGRLYVEHDISTNSGLFVRDDASFISNIFIGGDVSMNGKLAIGGDASLNSRVFIGSDLSMNGNLSIGGGISINGTLTIENLSMNGKLAIGEDASLNSRVFIGSDLSMNGNLSVGKDLSITGNLSVKQYSTKLTVYTVNYNNLTVDQDMSLNGRLFLTGDASMLGNVYMERNVGIGKTAEYALDISGGALQTSIGSSSNTYNNFYGKVPPSNVYLSSFSPNSINATGWSWTNNNIIYTVSQSGNNGTNYAYKLFDTSSSISARWIQNGYTAANFGAYTGSVSTINIQGISSVNGEWIQIKASAPVVMKSYSMTSWAGNSNYLSEFPGRYFILGSNDGIIWNRIIDVSFTSNPITGANINGGTVTIPTTTTSGGNINSITTNTGAGSVTGTFNTYDTTTKAYTHFRMIVTNKNTGGSLLEQYISLSEFTPVFSLETISGPSKTLLYMDSSNINQLDVSGSLALVNSNASSMTVIPNSTVATSHSWNNNNITWVVSASTTIGPSYNSYLAFNNSVSSGMHWASNGSCYNSTTGVYSGSTASITPTGQSAIQGEWLQLQSSVPLIMNSYKIGCVDTPLTYPRTFWIIGSNDGITWNPIHYATTTATSGVYTEGTHTGLFTVTSGSAVNGFTTVTTFSPYSSLSYTYFRLVTIATFPSSANTYTYLGEWTPYFSPVTSSVSMSLDNGVPNQLNIGGSLGVAGYLKQPFIGFNYARTGSNSVLFGIGAQIPIGSGGGYNTMLVDSGHISTTGTFTAPISGIYTFSFSVFTNNNSPAGTYSAALRKNATAYNNGTEICGTWLVTAAGTSGFNSATGIIQLNAGDTVTLWGFAGSGVMLTHGTNNNFCGYLISAI